jgi:hypothetical protein
MTHVEYIQQFWDDPATAITLLVDELLPYYRSNHQLAVRVTVVARQRYPKKPEFSVQSVKSWIHWATDTGVKTSRQPLFNLGVLFFRTLLDMKTLHENELVEMDSQ